MENKKIKAGILVLVSVIIFVLMYSFMAHKLFWKVSKNDNQEMSQNSELAKLELPAIDCSAYASDEAAYNKAIGTADINICGCVKEEHNKTFCEYTASDTGLYLEAVKQYDPKLCDLIQDTSRKEACLLIVKSGVDNLTENDPQYLANVYASAHNETVIGEYESLLQKEPNNIANLIALSLAYSEKGLNEQGRGGDQSMYVEKALAAAERVKSIDMNNSEAYRVAGYAYEIKPDIAKAIESYNKSIELDGSNILAYAGRGHANDLGGSTKDALLDFKKAAELDSKKEYGIIYSNLCRLEASPLRNFDNEIKNCNIAIGEKNNIVSRSESLQILASIYMPVKNYTQVTVYLIQAKGLTPNDPNLHISFANLYLAQGDYKKAEDSARKAIELSQTKAYAYLTLSYALKDQGNLIEAIDAVNKGLALVDTDVSLLEASKVDTKKTLYYSLADLYHITNDKDQEMKYKELGDRIN